MDSPHDAQLGSVPKASSATETPLTGAGGGPSDGRDERSLIRSWTNGRTRAAATVLFLGIVALALYLALPSSHDAPVAKYSAAYRFVEETVSKSAPVIISLPSGVEAAAAAPHIVFDPPIKGEWLPVPEPSMLAFKPAGELSVGTRYSVRLDSEGASIEADFMAAEDPKIEAFFPAADTEADEASEISVIFNRPMVPLTTLGVLEKEAIPVRMSPETPGTWKWISTRNLRFTPETRLLRAATYRVDVGKIRSVEGLESEGGSYSFKTRQLRYEHVSQGALSFDEPIVIAFNQPIDLDRTLSLVKVRGPQGEVRIIGEHGTRLIRNEDGKRERVVDRSILHIYQAEDSFKRKRLWDFEVAYSVDIQGAYPAEGGMPLSERRVTPRTVSGIIESVTALSPRSNNVRPDLFDPEGQLVLTFAEGVDLKKTSASAKGLRDVAYGKTCKKEEDGTVVYVGGTCEMTDDTKTLLLSFDPKAFSPGEAFDVTLQAVHNLEGLKMNPTQKTIPVAVYPRLRIDTFPADKASGASLQELLVCSNAPLKSRTREDYAQYLATKEYLVFSYWPNSWYRDLSSYAYPGQANCRPGQFETRIRYGLLPETSYQIALTLEDEFGGIVRQDLSFSTGKATEINRRLQNMQKVYNVTPPGRTRLTYAAENLEFFYVHVCKVSPETLLRYLSDRPEANLSPERLSCDEAKEDVISLPKRYFVNNYFSVDVSRYFKGYGHYVVTLYNPDRKDPYSKQTIYDKTYLSVTDLSVVQKLVNWGKDSNGYSWKGEDPRDKALRSTLALPGENLWWVTRAGTLAPVSGAKVTPYAGDGSEWESPNIWPADAPATTDEQGIARSKASLNVRGAVVRAGADSAVVSGWSDQLQYAGRAEDGGKTYIYSDRPIYRPGDTVNVRGIDRIGFDGSYRVWEGDVLATVFDSKGAKVAEQTVPMSEYGTFGFSLVIPADAPLGRYRVSALGRSGWFDVEEYVPAAFKVDASADKEEYIAGDTASITVGADYYFGVPVSGGSVSYAVTSQDYYFDRYKDEYFSFGSGWYYCYSCGSGDRFLTRGSVALSSDGTGEIKLPLDLEAYFKDSGADRSKIFVVNVTVKDASGRSVSSQKSFIVHRGEFYAGVKTDKYFAGVGEALRLRAKTVDTSGAPIAKGGLRYEAKRATWEISKRREVDGGYYYSSERRLETVASGSFSTDRKGDWSEEISLPQEGEYEIEVSGTDSRGNRVSAISRAYVYGPKQVTIRPTNNYSLELETDRLEAKPGDSPTIIIKSPYEKAKALVTIERGGIFDYKILDIDRNLFDFSFPIKDEYAPNVMVTADLLGPGPEIKHGMLEFRVDSDTKELSVAVVPDKQHYLPGEKVVLSVRTADYAGRPVPAEVSIAVADLSVLALKGNPKKDPSIFFYDGFPLTVTTASNIKNILYEIDVPLGTKGGGGGDPGDLERRSRGEFRDTAYWKGDVRTDASGSATVSFTLPDNLTTWQVESVGVTKDSLFGTDYDEIMAKKRVMVTPLRPRFIVPGDTFWIGAQVFNQTGERQGYEVSIESATLAIPDLRPRDVTIPAGSSATVYFEAYAPEHIASGAHEFTIAARGGDLEDTVVQRIPVSRDQTYETVATAGYSKSDRAIEYVHVPKGVLADRGGLSVSANATLAVYMTDALSYLISYPYGCSEQIASKLQSIAIVKRGLDVLGKSGEMLERIEFDGQAYSAEEAVKIGLARIYETQGPSGGFSYYPGLSASPHLTVRIIETFRALRSAGFSVNDGAMKRAAAAVHQSILSDPFLQSSEDFNLAAASAILGSGAATPQAEAYYREVVRRAASKLPGSAERLSSLSLGRLAVLAVRELSPADARRAFAAIEGRLAVDGRGAYVKENPKATMRGFYETPVSDTALFLKAAAAQKQDHPLLDKVLRWLLKSRSKDGAWGSTADTLAVVDAMTEYLSWKEEAKSDFTLELLWDGAPVASHEFAKESVLSTFTHSVDMKEVSPEKMHAIEFVRENRGPENNFYYDMAMTYYIPAEQVPPRDEGITLTREFFALDDESRKSPRTSAKVGEVVRGRLTIAIPKHYSLVSIEDFLPAGMELVNLSLSTEDQSLQEKNRRCGEYGCALGAGEEGEGEPEIADEYDPAPALGRFASAWSSVKRALSFQSAQVGELRDAESVRPKNPSFFPDVRELRDDRLFLFKEKVSPGVYEYEYFARALTPGTFRHMPAVAMEMYYPEVFGRTGGGVFTVTAP